MNWNNTITIPEKRTQYPDFGAGLDEFRKSAYMFTKRDEKEGKAQIGIANVN